MTRATPHAHGCTGPLQQVLRRGFAATLAVALALSPRTAVAADPDLSGLLSVLALVSEGDWIRVNVNRFSDIWPPQDLQPLEGLGNTQAVIGAWSSFAWDSNRGDLIIYGGGHANYAGNEVYRWRATTGLWERASLPSEVTQDVQGNYTAIDGPDAAPAAAHTYDNNVFLPIADRFVTFGGAAFNNGGAYLRAVGPTGSRATGPYFFDPAKADPNRVGGTTGSHVQRVAPHPEILGGNMWENRDIYLNVPGSPPLPGSNLQGMTAYAQEGGKDVVYVGAPMGLGTDLEIYRYVVNDLADPTADTWEQVGLYWDRTGAMGAAAYDPLRKAFVVTGDNAKPFWFWNLNTPGPTNKNQGVAFADAGGQFAAALATTQIGNYGMDFDPVRGQFVLWGGGGTVWALKPPPTLGTTGWTVTKQPAPASATPTTDVGTGILGKWKYIASLDAFMGLQDSVDGNVWIYKPIGWINPSPPNLPPTVALSAPAAGKVYTAPAHVNLAASAADPDGTIVVVEFFEGGIKLGESRSAPFTFDWNGVAAGSYSLTARATDDAGASTDSSPVVITVATTPALQFALYRPSTNKYLVDYDFDQVPDLKQGFGAPGDVGLAGRIDADALSDFVLYRSNGLWFGDTNRSGTVTFFAAFGGLPGDVPLLADFDGDGRDDLVIYRTGLWYVSTARDGTVATIFALGGAASDIPLAGDVDGDGIADLVIYRNGFWYIDTHHGPPYIPVAFGGLPEDIPVLFDWDGDGKADLCIFRNGLWYVNTGLDGTVEVMFGYGAPGDAPLTGVFR